MENLLDQWVLQSSQWLNQAEKEISEAVSQEELLKIRVNYFGKKGLLTEMLKQIGRLPSQEEKTKFGSIINELKSKLQMLFDERLDNIVQQALHSKLAEEAVDVTLPGRKLDKGSLHPVMQIWDRIVSIFSALGFDLAEGPEIETEGYNFEKLNIPRWHPSRTEQDTFYLKTHAGDEEGSRLLRTHTSPIQIRYMHTHTPPFRVIMPGRVYRPDFDATHTPMFHQVEGLVVDKTVNFGHLKGMIDQFLSDFFEKQLTIRFRSSYFPFTEPSAEVDIQCVRCQGKGCSLCGSGWIEVLGAGMVHPNVLQAGGVDSEYYRGYAFGFGIDRFALLYYQIDDLRRFFENDLRFLQQF